MDLETNQLKDLAGRDDQAATIQLIELFYERVYAFLRRLAGSDADAADLTQRTFSRVQQSLPTFAGRSSVSSWIHGIAYHTYIDWRRASRPTESRPDAWWEGFASGDAGPDEIVARDDFAKALYTRVEGLEPELRESVHLHYYQGLTLQETADAMGVAGSTIKYRLRQAVAELQKQLAGPPVPGTGANLRTV